MSAFGGYAPASSGKKKQPFYLRSLQRTLRKNRDEVLERAVYHV